MRKGTILAFILCCTGILFSQQIDYNRIVPSAEYRPRTFKDYLVQLAWDNSAQGKALYNRQNIAGLETDLTQRDWMKNASVQFNLNEISLNNLTNPDDEVFVPVPLWNITANVDMDMLFNRKKKVEISRQKEEIAQHNINQLKMRTRAAVLETYNAYLLSIDLLKVRKEAEQFSLQTRTLVTELFEQNKAEFEEVSRAADVYAKSREAVLEAEAAIRDTKSGLEALIGIPYEEAERLGALYKKE